MKLISFKYMYGNEKNKILMTYDNYLIMESNTDLLEYLSYHNMDNYKEVVRKSILEFNKRHPNCPVKDLVNMKSFFNLINHGCFTNIKVPMATIGLESLAFQGQYSGVVDTPISLDKILKTSFSVTEEILSDKINIMKNALDDGNIVFLNKCGGYFYASKNEIQDLIVHGDIDIKNFVGNDKYDKFLKEEERRFKLYDDILIVQEKSGKVYFGKYLQLHIDICEENNLNEDDCNKYRFNKNNKKECLFGIEGLFMTEKYSESNLAFVPKKYHLDILEKEIQSLLNSIKEL